MCEILRIYDGGTIREFFIEANIFHATVIEILYSFIIFTVKVERENIESY